MTREEQLQHLQDLVDTAFEDVEADFPEAECGWEVDVARSTVGMEVSQGTVDRATADQFMQMAFGVRLDQGANIREDDY